MNDTCLNELKSTLRDAENGLIGSLQMVKHLIFQVTELQDVAEALRKRHAENNS